MIVTVFVSDRGPLYIHDCFQSWQKNVTGCERFNTINDADHKLGMAGAVRAAWTYALDEGADYLFHVEEDFRFLEPVNLLDLVYVLERAPYLAQVVLKRQPWNAEEIAAGGIIEANPDAYRRHNSLRHSGTWTEHQEIFSLNPCLIPRRVLELGWPDGNESEFTARCLDQGYRFAFYGNPWDAPRVEHVGTVRAAGWRL